MLQIIVSRRHSGAWSNAAISPSVCLSVCLSVTRHLVKMVRFRGNKKKHAFENFNCKNSRLWTFAILKIEKSRYLMMHDDSLYKKYWPSAILDV